MNSSLILRITGFVLYCQFFQTSAFAQLPVFDADNAFTLLEKQCSFGPRNPGSEGHRQCRDWIYSFLNEYTSEVYLQNFTIKNPVSSEDHELTNIIARFDGNSKSPIMLCAHWDTRPQADKDPDPDMRDTPILGANDGASGVAVLLELSRIFQQHPPNHPVIIILFDGEDMGKSGKPHTYALGSEYWASHQIPEPVERAILLDMIGDADLQIFMEGYSYSYSRDFTEELWQMAHDLNLDAFIPQVGSPIFDDHVRLQNVGIEAIDIIDFDYPYWHTVEDTPDKCSAASLDQVGRLLIEYLYTR